MQALAQRTQVGALLRLAALGCALLAGFALHDAPPRAAAVHALPSSSTGSVALANSRGTGAILSARNMDPGTMVTGSVTLVNGGDSPAALTLSQSELHDTIGSGGGRLSRALVLTVDDVSAARRVYEGPLSSLAPVALGTLQPGDGHAFRFTVRMAHVPTARYQNAATSVRYDWTAGTIGEGDGGTSVNPDTRAPLLTLGGKGRQRARKAALTASCDESCTLAPTVKLAKAKGVKRPKLVLKPANLAAGARGRVLLRFDRRSLKRLRKASATVTVTATDGAGNRSVAKRRIKLTR